ncbi:hypothetical protein AB3662_44195 [Sorangium cellulosum]|uniref:hypothetical protein n=1 Tax=Sorangium cellulosum TaxID=56 RepID=UPI003D9A3B44
MLKHRKGQRPSNQATADLGKAVTTPCATSGTDDASSTGERVLDQPAAEDEAQVTQPGQIPSPNIAQRAEAGLLLQYPQADTSRIARPASPGDTIKLANSSTRLTRAELEKAFQAAKGRRGSSDELRRLLEALEAELRDVHNKNQAASKGTANDKVKFERAIQQLKKFEEDRKTLSEFDEIAQQESFDASVALLKILLPEKGDVPSPEATYGDLRGRIEDRLRELDDKIKALGEPPRPQKAQEQWRQATTEKSSLARLQVDLKEGYAAIAGASGSERFDAAVAAILALPKFKPKSIDSYSKPQRLVDQLANQLRMLKSMRDDGPVMVDANLDGLDPRGHIDKLKGMLLEGATMTDIKNNFDVLARRTGAANDTRVVGVHEVDAAFIKEVHGLSEVKIVPAKSDAGFELIGGGGVGEKVFAFGQEGALGFRENFQKREERFYALILPKGFVSTLGFDVRTKNSGGASAREPNFEEFRKHRMEENKQAKDPAIDIPGGKLFFIRAENSTAEGQVDFHFSWRNMQINGERISQVDFVRRYVLAVVEFDDKGRTPGLASSILCYQIFH